MPFPVDYRTYGDDRDFKLSLAAVDALQKLKTALHEWIGLAAYQACSSSLPSWTKTPTRRAKGIAVTCFRSETRSALGLRARDVGLVF